MAKFNRQNQRRRRHMRLRRKISGSEEVPRMAVCKTGRHLYVQFIDDLRQHTLASVSTMDQELRAQDIKCNLAGAQVIGKAAAEKAKAAGITKVVFDRGGFRFHGRIKAVADAAREAGLQF